MDSISSDTPQDKKKCSKCGEEFPATLDFFNKNGNRLRSECKGCTAKWRKEYDARPEVKEYKRIASAEWESAHYEERHEYHTEYNQTHREERREASKRCYHNRPPEVNRVRRFEYRQSEHGKMVEKAYEQSEKGKAVRKSISHKRRVGRHFRRNSFTATQFLAQLKRQNYCCYYCDEKHTEDGFVWHADHIIPLSRGGSNDISNVVAACPPCNLSKGNKLLHEWIRGGRLL